MKHYYIIGILLIAFLLIPTTSQSSRSARGDVYNDDGEKEYELKELKDSYEKMIRIGDYYYGDGTTSHTLDYAKNVVGIVFSLETTPEEQAKGWSKGYIICMSDVNNGKSFMWAKKPGDLTSPHNNFEWFKEDKTVVCNDMIGYIYEQSGQTYNGEFFPAFHACRNYPTPLPGNDISSNWYMPSMGQWILIIENLGKVKVEKNGDFDQETAAANLARYHFEKGSYWTSTERNKQCAWFVNIDNGHIENNNKDWKLRVRAIAAI